MTVSDESCCASQYHNDDKSTHFTIKMPLIMPMFRATYFFSSGDDVNQVNTMSITSLDKRLSTERKRFCYGKRIHTERLGRR